MSDFKTILPPTATSLETALEKTAATRFDALQFSIAALWSADEVLEDHLPWLAWSVSVDVWKAHWSLDVKRRMVLASFEAHKLKGTRAAVETVMSALSVRTSLTEWFEDNAAPHTFKIIAYAGEMLDPTDDVFLSPRFASLLDDLIGEVKPLRSHFTLQIAARAPVKLAVATHATAGTAIRRVVNPTRADARQRADLALASCARAASILRLRLDLGVSL
jgi:phage tail P2-like protein